MAATQQPKGFLGTVALAKTAGQISPGPAIAISPAYTYTFPLALAAPRNPDNFAYPPTLNAQGAPSVKVQGKKTPSVSLTGIPLKSSFCTPAFFLDLIGGGATYLDTNNNSSEYLIGINNGSSTRYYQGCKCQMLSIYQTAAGGPILLDMGWLAMFGDGETGASPYNAPSITMPATPDAGTLLDVTKVTFSTENLSAVYSWRLTLMRPQGYQMEADGTLYSDVLQSGMIGGTFHYTTSPLSATVLAAATSIAIASTTSVTFTIQVQRDELAQDVAASLGVESLAYTLIKSTAGYPVAIA